VKIALFGRGKTGSTFLQLAGGRHEVRVFSRAEPARAEDLRDADLAVVFVPGPTFGDLAPLLLESRLPVVSGTTGFDYTRLQPLAPWIVASNFSLGMNVTFLLTRILAGAERISRGSFQVHEIHHTGKIDSPSGTALHLRSLLPEGTEITAERLGDAKGLHRVELSLPGEKILVQHEALDRSVFGAGALYAAEELLPALSPGLHSFEKLMDERLRKEIYD
jgi:4-hydroxy-tetrahydrodipicolinate reductase